MAKKKKMATRDFLDFDQVVGFGEKIKIYCIENARQLIAIGLTICLATGAVVFWTISSTASAQTAQGMLNRALSTMSAPAETEAERTAALSAAIADLNKIVEHYSATEAGQVALFYLAQCKSRQKDYNGAIADYSEFLKHSNWAVDQLRSLAFENLGYAHEALGNSAEALKWFEMAAQAGRDAAHIGIARMHEDSGSTELACEHYKKYLAEQDNTAYRELADIKVRDVCR